MKEGTGGQHGLIIRERMLNGNALHLVQGKALGTIVQETGLFRSEVINSMNTGEAARHPGDGEGMGKAGRL
jgi:hypothetical protein